MNTVLDTLARSRVSREAVPDSDDIALLTDVALATGAAAAGVLDPGLGIAAAGAAAGLAGSISPGIGRSCAPQHAGNRRGVRSAGIEVAPAVEALLRTGEGLVLVETALRSAASAAFAEKPHALGTCIGGAGADGTEAEASWARLIELLQRRHVLALLALEDPKTERPGRGVVFGYRNMRMAHESTRTGALLDASKPYDTFTANSVTADLSGWGLARTVIGAELGFRGGAPESDTFWLPTALGRRVTERLRQDANG